MNQNKIRHLGTIAMMSGMLFFGVGATEVMAAPPPPGGIYDHPRFHDRPYYFHNGRYYYGGEWRNGYYYYRGKRYYGGRYHHRYDGYRPRIREEVFNYPRYRDRPFYYYKGRYYYGGVWRNGAYHFRGHRYYGGRYYRR
ncbi:MAG: hypothetical protein PHV08_01625 [Sulfurovaceae bacterium]|nr:hypothetical protein [Sulfurovaceae bacterium]